MRNSTYAFIAAVLVAIWFEVEVTSAGNICVTSCIDLTWLNLTEQIIAAAILPIIIVLIAINMRRNENRLMKQKSGTPPPKTD